MLNGEPRRGWLTISSAPIQPRGVSPRTRRERTGLNGGCGLVRFLSRLADYREVDFWRQNSNALKSLWRIALVRLAALCCQFCRDKIRDRMVAASWLSKNGWRRAAAAGAA